MNIDGLWLAGHPDVYEPSDDTLLLARAVREHIRPGQRLLEVGCGAGLIALTAARAGAQVLATDRNADAAALTLHNSRQNGLRVDVVVTDLLAGVAADFDVVAFNPPYLPTADDEHVEGPLDWAFDGGPDGNLVVLRFVDQLGKLPRRPAQVLVVHSDLSDPAPLDAAMETLGYSVTVAASVRLPFEELTVRRYC